MVAPDMLLQLVARLQAEQQATIEQERSRIARDIHDGPAQNIAHVIQKLELIQRSIEKQPQVALREVSRAHDLLVASLNDLRCGISSLMPSQLEEQSLDEALRSLLDDYSIQEPGLTIHYEVEQSQLWPPALKLPIYRLIQEALNNVRKHAYASEVTIRIRPLSGLLVVQVSDNGAGFVVEQVRSGRSSGPFPPSRGLSGAWRSASQSFAPSASAELAVGVAPPGEDEAPLAGYLSPRQDSLSEGQVTLPIPSAPQHLSSDRASSIVAPGFGLRTMQERVQQAGGLFEISSTPGEGTMVKARFPLKDPSAVLTIREREVLRLLVEGATNRVIAQKLSVSIETVKSHVRHIMQKMQVKDRTQAAVLATKQHWLEER